MRKLESALALSFVLGACTFACESGPPVPPPELSGARTEVSKAQQAPTSQLAPTEVHDASESLNKAETSFSDEPYSANTVDEAAAAKARAEAAQARASAIQAHADKEKTERAYEQAQAQRIQEQQQALAAMDQKQAAACDVMGQVAKVKRERDAAVVTFQSDALFQFNKSELTPEAQQKLDQVAAQIHLGFDEHKLHVVGFTDSVGGKGPGNQALSEQRAAAVKDYLVSKGIKGDLIDSSGRGPMEPVGDNKTDAGRSLNRRVEIIIEPAATK
jgi:outer membrane protein OmpA-like peptidoglycan-associated protein